MNLTKTQRQLHNFLTLAQEAGSLSKLAKLCGYRTPVALYKLKQCLEKQAEDPDARGIRPSLMAKLEKHTGKPKGWLDRKHRERTVPETAAESTGTAETQIAETASAAGCRSVTVNRNTCETQITVSINLDGSGKSRLDTGVPFLEHMIDQIARHGMIDIDISCKGDLHIDDHHTAEDIGITLGQAIRQALGDKKGIRRYGHSYVPLDEALSRVVIDLSGRPGLVYNIEFTRALIGRFDVDLFEEFFHGIVNHSMMTLHIDNLSGKNAHHQAETVFKAFGRALRMAVEHDPRMAGQTPSTKGTLTA